MKIKSIKPTNKFVEIKFAEIIKDPANKKVYTPSGFQPVLACEHIKSGPTLRITTFAGELVCDPQHRFLVRQDDSILVEKFAQDLLPTDKLIGYKDSELPFIVEPGPIEDLYDIQLPDPHWWYTSGVVSHNSIMLCNNAISSLKGEGPDGTNGQDVLLVTFELDTIKTAMRCLATSTGIPTSQVVEKQDYIKRVVGQMKKTYKKRFLIHEMPPDECSVNHIYALMDSLKRTEGWKPDVIILDYMDLMVSRNPAYNKDDYIRQKHIASEIRGLAKNENVLIFTATQTNRSGARDDKDGSRPVDMTSAAESFGKQFALDYVISLNQSMTQRAMSPPRMGMFVAKNRNGPREVTISCEINYDNMVVKELL